MDAGRTDDVDDGKRGAVGDGRESDVDHGKAGEVNERERNPLVSAIVTTYNRRQLVCDAVDSALDQTYEPMELIVVDDGSTDGTPELLRERYADRIRLIELDGPSGVSRSRNAGVDAAAGAFIAFLDDDDLWVPRTIEKQMDVMLAHGDEVAIVGGACKYIDLEGREVLKPSVPPAEAGYEDFCVRLRLPGTTSNQVVRRSAFAEVGGFDERLIRAEDKDLWIRILRHYEVRYTRDVTCLKRIHQGERVLVDLDVIKEARRAVDRKIPEPSLRRKATAWSYFDFFRHHWPRQPVRAVGYLLLSFLVHPTALGPDIDRFRSAIWHVRT